MNFVFQNAFYCHVCHRSLCVISWKVAYYKNTNVLNSGLECKSYTHLVEN